MEIFRYGQTELDHLKKKDKKLGTAIERIGILEREVIPDLFTALVNSIVSQQISNKALATVWGRMLERLGSITPEAISRASLEDIQKCGMSMRKAEYIKSAGETVTGGMLNLSELYGLADAEVAERLSSLHGVGVWTAEMLMIFSMQRPDIVSWGDLAIRRGMMLLYGHEKLDKAQFERYRKRYSPYGSVASLYLWEVAAGR